MSVIETQSLLYKFVKACKDQPLERSYFTQCEILCDPLKGLFSETSTEELHYQLLVNGLFEPEEWMNIETAIRKMEKRKMWKMVEKEYKRLKEEWDGPEIPIVIFPIKKAHRSASKLVIKKNGVAFKEALFLFLSPDLITEEINALLAHEYNHVCRLSFLDVEEEDLPLKESLVMEGLGECAVQELYGERWLAPWIHLYTYEDVITIWSEQFYPNLNIKGTDKHQIFLHGNGDKQFPKWIGYNIGFQITNSFRKRHESFTSRDLLSLPSEELIAGSEFPYK